MQAFPSTIINVTLRTSVEVKPVVMICASMELHADGGGYTRGGQLLHRIQSRSKQILSGHAVE